MSSKGLTAIIRAMNTGETICFPDVDWFQFQRTVNTMNYRGRCNVTVAKAHCIINDELHIGGAVTKVGEV